MVVPLLLLIRHHHLLWANAVNDSSDVSTVLCYSPRFYFLYCCYAIPTTIYCGQMLLVLLLLLLLLLLAAAAPRATTTSTAATPQ